MAGSRKSNRSSARDDLAAQVRHRLEKLVRPADRLVLGFSGGVDSSVLLHVLAGLRDPLQFELRALHVNHHLSPHGEEWAAFCARKAGAYGVPCRVVDVSLARRNGVERAAREARHAAFDAEPADFVVLAHNLDDQAETVLHRLMRGAGVKGLAAMPLLRTDPYDAVHTRRGAARILRPLIAVSRGEIARYAAAHRLEWIEDESNADTHHTRNWLRHEILPRLAERVPAVRSTLARAATHMAEASGLLDDLARIDAGDGAESSSVRLDALRTLPPSRAKNLLRFLVARGGWSMPPSGRLEEALRQGLEARRDATVHVDLGACEVRRHAGVLYLLPKSTVASVQPVLTWHGEAAIALPGWGTLIMGRTHGEGLSAARLSDAAVTIRARAGGERLKPHRDRPRRTVKNLLQEAGLPPWERDRLPYIYCGEDLVCVPGVAIDCRFEAGGGEPAIVPVWRAGQEP